jgi:hypothetical protein
VAIGATRYLARILAAGAVAPGGLALARIRSPQCTQQLQSSPIHSSLCLWLSTVQQQQAAGADDRDFLLKIIKI